MATAPNLYYVSGCRCYMGQGYSPCDCPALLELDEDDYNVWCNAPKDEDIPLQPLITKATHRTTGRIVNINGTRVLGECTKEGRVGKTMEFHLLMQRTLDLSEHAYRFRVTYNLNGENRHWPTNNLATLCESLELTQAYCRSTLWTLLVEDGDLGCMWCFAAHETGPNGCIYPQKLVDKGGPLSACVEEKEVRLRRLVKRSRINKDI